MRAPKSAGAKDTLLQQNIFANTHLYSGEVPGQSGIVT